MAQTDIPRIPQGWPTQGHLPPFDIEHATEESTLTMFGADMMRIHDHLGMYSIEIGWFPDADQGVYRVAVIRGAVAEPVSQTYASTVAALRQSLAAAVEYVQHRIAQ